MRNIGDVRHPELIKACKHHRACQVRHHWPAVLRIRRDRNEGSFPEAQQIVLSHQTLDALVIDQKALSSKFCSDPPIAVEPVLERWLCARLVDRPAFCVDLPQPPENCLYGPCVTFGVQSKGCGFVFRWHRRGHRGCPVDRRAGYRIRSARAGNGVCAHGPGWLLQRTLEEPLSCRTSRPNCCSSSPPMCPQSPILARRRMVEGGSHRSLAAPSRVHASKERCCRAAAIGSCCDVTACCSLTSDLRSRRMTSR